MANLLIKGATSGTTTMAAVDNITATITLPATTGVFPVQDSATGALYLPAGTTAQRPGTPATGQWRFNSDLNVLEYYNGTAWYSTTAVGPPPTVEYLVVAGGGGSSSNISGGGGAGGFRTASGFAVTAGSALTVTVGAGGALGFNGADSVFSSITSVGGGAGGDNSTYVGKDGGSGGGAGRIANSTPHAGGLGTSGQGNNGGSCNGGGTPCTYFGDGGGGGGR